MQVSRAMTTPLNGTGPLSAPAFTPAAGAAAPASVTIETRPAAPAARDTAALGTGSMKKSQTSSLSLGGPAAGATAPTAAPAVAEPAAADEASLIGAAAEAVDGVRGAKATAEEVAGLVGEARDAARGVKKAADAAEDAVSKVPLAGGVAAAYDAVTGGGELASAAVAAVKDPAKAAAAAKEAVIAKVAESPTGAIKEAKDKAVELKELGTAAADTGKAAWQGGKQVAQNVAAEGLTGGLKTTAKQAGASVARQGAEVAGAAKGMVAKATGKGVAKEVAQEVAQVAAREVAEAGVKAGAKGLARFAPGVNVAMAAIDTAHAVSVCNDPQATGWQKGCACVTAVGSIAAASNIPGVSQVGAAVSIVSGIAESIDPKAAVGAVKGAASRVASWFGW